MNLWNLGEEEVALEMLMEDLATSDDVTMEDAEELARMQEELEYEIEEKLESFVKIIQNKKAMVKARKEEEKRIKELRQTDERALARMMSMVDTYMSKTGAMKLETTLGVFAKRKSEKLIVECDAVKVPAEFTKQVLEVKVDKRTLKKAIKDGLVVEGVHIEQSYNLGLK